MCVWEVHCLIPIPYSQRQKYSYFPTVLWDVSRASVSRGKDGQVHLPISQEFTPQPLAVRPTQFGTEPTLILKFLQCLCCLMRLRPRAADKRELLYNFSSSGRMVATERRVLTFSFILLLPQVILPFIKAFSSHAYSTVLLCSGKNLIDLIWWYLSCWKWSCCHVELEVSIHRNLHCVVDPEGQILLLPSN